MWQGEISGLVEAQTIQQNVGEVRSFHSVAICVPVDFGPVVFGAAVVVAVRGGVSVGGHAETRVAPRRVCAPLVAGFFEVPIGVEQFLLLHYVVRLPRVAVPSPLERCAQFLIFLAI